MASDHTFAVEPVRFEDGRCDWHRGQERCQLKAMRHWTDRLGRPFPHKFCEQHSRDYASTDPGGLYVAGRVQIRRWSCGWSTTCRPTT